MPNFGQAAGTGKRAGKSHRIAGPYRKLTLPPPPNCHGQAAGKRAAGLKRPAAEVEVPPIRNLDSVTRRRTPRR